MGISNIQSNSVNRLSAAVKLLSQYYASLGRGDIIGIINRATLGSNEDLATITGAIDEFR